MRASLESTEQVHRQRELVLSLKVAGQGRRLQTQAEANSIVLRKKNSLFQKTWFCFQVFSQVRPSQWIKTVATKPDDLFDSWKHMIDR